MTNWKKMSIEATNYQYIVGIFNQFDEENNESTQCMDILYFDGIRNRWNSHNCIMRGLMMKDIDWYIPLPELNQTRQE